MNLLSFFLFSTGVENFKIEVLAGLITIGSINEISFIKIMRIDFVICKYLQTTNS